MDKFESELLKRHIAEIENLYGFSMRWLRRYRNFPRYELRGYADGCFHCGKPLGDKYSFCPFTEPIMNSCNRFWCRLKRTIKDYLRLLMFAYIDMSNGFNKLLIKYFEKIF
jgi:hypothetical protein